MDLSYNETPRTAQISIYLTTVEALLTNALENWQLYLRAAFTKPRFFNSHKNSVFLHSRKRPAHRHFPLPEGVRLWELPVYLRICESGNEAPYLPFTHGGPPTINTPPFPSKKSSKHLTAVAPNVVAMVNRLCLPRKKLTGLKRKKPSLLINRYFCWKVISRMNNNSAYNTFAGSTTLS